MTKHESFDSAASFVRKFVDGNLDLNNTYQSIPEGDEEEEDGGGEGVDVDVDDSQRSESEGEGEEAEEEEEDDEGSDVVSGEEENEEGKGKQAESGSSDEWSEEEAENRGDGSEHSLDESRSSSEAGSSKHVEKEAISGQHSTSYLLLSQIKRSLELQELQLVRERKSLAEQKSSQQQALEVEKKQVEVQRQNLQRLIADYHKMKSSKVEHETKIKELTDKLQETKLEMSKRITRWGEQQRRLEARVKALESENAELKKQKSLPYRPALLKRPPLPLKPGLKQPKKIHFADNLNSKDDSPPKVNPSKLKVTNILPSDDADKDNSQNESTAPAPPEQPSSSPQEVCLSDDEADKTMPSDYVEVKHPCGTITRITKDNTLTRHVMPNKDIMDEFDDCSVRYYYAEQGFSQITYPNGDEIIEYDSGVLETNRSDGSKIYTYTNGLVKLLDPTSSSSEIYFPDGSVLKQSPNGISTITWPSGQKEERTSTYTKRTYTNGTIKLKYVDGSEETRYWNGRVRRKDKNGQLVDDTKKQKVNKSSSDK